MLPAAAVPLNVGVVSDVMLSLFEVPRSLAGSRSGALGSRGDRGVDRDRERRRRRGGDVAGRVGLDGGEQVDAQPDRGCW